jgi:hypothetical protein
MREVWHTTSDKRVKAEEILKKDDVVGRQSIYVRDCRSLGLAKEGYVIIIDGSDKALEKANELLKGLAEKYKNKEEVLKKFEEEEQKATEAFGFIIGG